VISVNGTKTTVGITVASECMGCPSKSYCNPDAAVSREITVINEYGAEVSDHVIFEVDSGKVIVSAALMWILPLISMIIGYIVGDRFAAGFWPIVMSFIFLVLAFTLLKLLDKAISGGKTFYPRITKIIHSSKFNNDV